jgi:toxin
MHSTLSTAGRKVGNNLDEVTLANGDKVYKAVIEVQDSAGNWIKKSGNKGVSSFFPGNWGYQKIIDEVNLVVKNGSFVTVSKNSHRYTNPSTGLTIEIYLENLATQANPIWGKVISAFPVI